MPLDQFDIEKDKLPEQYWGKLPEKPKKKDEAEMSLIEHLDVLRGHVIRSVLAIVIVAIAVGVFVTFFFDNIILAPTDSSFITHQLMCELAQKINPESVCFESENIEFFNRDVTGQFTLHMRTAFTLGLIIAFPFLVFQIWKFVKPGLHVEEQKISSGVVVFCSLFFFMGVLVSYYFIVPVTFRFLIEYNISDKIVNETDIRSYISLLVDITLACGIMFQLPVFVYILSKLGIMTPAVMIKFRKHAILVIFILSAVLTPADVASMVLLALPLILLYELSIQVSGRVISKNQEKEVLK